MFIHKEVIHQLGQVQTKLRERDNQIMVIFEYLKQLEAVKQQEPGRKKRNVLASDIPEARKINPFAPKNLPSAPAFLTGKRPEGTAAGKIYVNVLKAVLNAVP